MAVEQQAAVLSVVFWKWVESLNLTVSPERRACSFKKLFVFLITTESEG